MVAVPRQVVALLIGPVLKPQLPAVVVGGRAARGGPVDALAGAVAGQRDGAEHQHVRGRQRRSAKRAGREVRGEVGVGVEQGVHHVLQCLQHMWWRGCEGWLLHSQTLSLACPCVVVRFRSPSLGSCEEAG